MFVPWTHEKGSLRAPEFDQLRTQEENSMLEERLCWLHLFICILKSTFFQSPFEIAGTQSSHKIIGFQVPDTCLNSYKMLPFLPQMGVRLWKKNTQSIDKSEWLANFSTKKGNAPPTVLPVIERNTLLNRNECEQKHTGFVPFSSRLVTIGV